MVTVAVVAGAGSGIGAATAIHLAALHDVVVGDLYVDGSLEAVAEATERAGARALTLQVDVRQEEQIADIIGARQVRASSDRPPTAQESVAYAP